VRGCSIESWPDVFHAAPNNGMHPTADTLDFKVQ
jgi:hypothetical protein